MSALLGGFRLSALSRSRLCLALPTERRTTEHQSGIAGPLGASYARSNRKAQSSWRLLSPVLMANLAPDQMAAAPYRPSLETA